MLGSFWKVALMPRILTDQILVRLLDPEEKAALAAAAEAARVEVLRATGAEGLSHWLRMLGCRDAGIDPQLPGEKKIEKSSEKA